MADLNIVLAHEDGPAAEALAAGLWPVARSVIVTRSWEEVRTAVPRQRANLAVLDLETVSLSEVAALHREFPETALLCVHRLPDEAMWAAALAAGAVDCCCSADVNGVVQAVQRSMAMPQSSAA